MIVRNMGAIVNRRQQIGFVASGGHDLVVKPQKASELSSQFLSLRARPRLKAAGRVMSGTAGERDQGASPFQAVGSVLAPCTLTGALHFPSFPFDPRGVGTFAIGSGSRDEADSQTD